MKKSKNILKKYKFLEFLQNLLHAVFRQEVAIFVPSSLTQKEKIELLRKTKRLTQKGFRVRWM